MSNNGGVKLHFDAVVNQKNPSKPVFRPKDYNNNDDGCQDVDWQDDEYNLLKCCCMRV